MKMRPYQENAIAGAFKAWEENTSALIVLPTGLGKTVVFSEIVRRMQPLRSMVIAHREELIFQAAEKIKKVTGLDGGIEMGEYHADGGFFGTLPPYVVSTVQTQCSGGDGGVYFTPEAALDVVRGQTADIVTMNPPLSTGGYLGELLPKVRRIVK